LNSYTYKVFGVIVTSEFELPELSVKSDDVPDIRIQTGQVPRKLKNPTSSGPLFELAPYDFILRFDSVGAFRAQNGNQITIQPANTITPDVRLFVLGTMMGIILMQRGLLPMHGSSFLTRNGAVLITGYSGSGKSTLAMAMQQKNFPILSDDISALQCDQVNGIDLHVGMQHLKLWKDVIDYLGNTDPMKKVRPSIEKYQVPSTSFAEEGPFPLKTIICLSAKTLPGFTIEKINGAMKFGLLKSQIFRNQFFESIGDPYINFNNLAMLAKVVDVYIIGRPSIPLLIHELADFVENEIVKEN